MSWPMVKLGDVAPAKPLKNVSADADEEVWHLNLDMVEAQSGKILQKIYAPVADAGISTHWFDDSYVLYSKLRPYLNKVVLPDEKGLATTELVPMLPDPKRLDRKYLAYYLRSNSFVSWISEQVAGAKMPRVSMNVFWQHEIPLPPLEEQKRIAAILDKADAIRQKRQQAIELADEFLRSVFLDMFGDPLINPKGWDVESLSSLIHIQGGYAFKSADFGTEGIPVVKIGNANKKGFTAENIDFIQPELPENLKQYELFPGDLLMSLTGTVGKDDYGNITEVTDEYNKYYLNQRVAKLSIKSSKINKDYFNFCLSHQSMKNELIKNNRGVRQANINNSDIYELEIPIADINAQNNFSEVVGKMKSIVQSLIKTEPLINNTFSSLSQIAFSGQL
jgi:Restriction endonuclease S subunits